MYVFSGRTLPECVNVALPKQRTEVKTATGTNFVLEFQVADSQIVARWEGALVGNNLETCRNIVQSVVQSFLDALSFVEGCAIDRKSTRLNSSHLVISYAVFCL